MNDLIYDMIERCQIDRRTITQSGEIVDDTILNTEKFAELIVKECADICLREHWAHLAEHPYPGDEFGRGQISGKKLAASECARKINRYFGVK